MRSLRNILFETSGAEIAETAAVLPVLFTVLLGIFFFGRAYNIYGTINQAAMQGARAALAPACATCGDIVCGGTPGRYPCDATVAAVVGSTLQASKLDPAAVATSSYSPPFCAGGGACSTTNNVKICRGVKLNASTPEVCGVAVAFQYPYTFNLPFNSFSLQMKAVAQMREEDQQ